MRDLLERLTEAAEILRGDHIENVAELMEEAAKGFRQMREKNRELNRRAQEAEGIIARSGVVERRPQGSHGRSLGRAIANYHAAQMERERDAALDLLRRLREWDHLDTAGDGPYWKAELDKVLGETNGT